MSTPLRVCRLSLLFLSVLFSSSREASAQDQASASLVVTTHTLQSQAVPNATIKVQSVPAVSRVTENIPASHRNRPCLVRRGLPGLAPGSYRVTILAKGFDELTTDVTVVPTTGGGAAAGAYR